MTCLMKIDMHTHTTFSDGRYTPEVLFRHAKSANLDGLAITDHDTLDGLREAKRAADTHGLMLLPGVEISTSSEGTSVHILGYGVSMKDDTLSNFLQKYRNEKYQRMVNILSKLNNLGFAIDMNDLDASDMSNLGRPHVAHAMVKKGHVSSKDEAFEKYLVRGRPAYVPREKADTEETIAFLKEAGILPVLAHPGLIHASDKEILKKRIKAWIAAGLRGIEAFHPAHTKAECQQWETFAQKNNLLVTGGSDFHEEPPGNQHGSLGQMIKSWANHENDTKIFLQSLKLLDRTYA